MSLACPLIFASWMSILPSRGLMGFKKEHLVGRTYRQLAGVVDPLLIERCGRVALSGEQDAFEIYSHKVERHFELKVYRPAPLQFAVLIRESREDRDSLPVKHEFPQDRGLSRLADCASVSEERGLFL